MNDEPKLARRGRRPRETAGASRIVNYRNLRNPFTPQKVFSDDEARSIHETALRVLQELGLRVLLPEARARFRQAGALVDEDTQMVRIGREIVERTLATPPRSFTVRGGSAERDNFFELGTLAFQPCGGPPHASDIVRGRRPAGIADFTDAVKLLQHYDVIHMHSANVEAQDLPIHLRHYATMRAQTIWSDKAPFVYARGNPQTMDGFEMLRIARGLSHEQFKADAWCTTVINTNSPRQIDIPMAQGLIDFALNGQPCVVTPFCLMGAMAPVTVAGALTLSHAEALGGIALNQLANPGAPVFYGAFASNVDMKSGAPAFGTPEEVKCNIASGQLARIVGLPWRCAAATAANVNDAQAAHETEMSCWGAVLAGCSLIMHAAGWLEGGLTLSFEKFITDIDMLNTFAELCAPTQATDADLAFDALKEVQPGGHFFGAAHTMERYQTAFYEPVAADWSNFGTWSERGSRDATTRAHDIYRRVVDEAKPVPIDPARVEELDAYIAKRTEQGGAPPVS